MQYLAPALPPHSAQDRTQHISWRWWYRKYAPGDTVLEGLEKEAREAKKGLWVDPAPVPPREWRKRSR
jgi:hypothetical protein